MDFSVASLEGLGQADRRRLCRQLRQKQVENYLDFVTREMMHQPDPPRPLPRRPNKRDTAVRFHDNVCLQSAVEESDEKEVLHLLQKGCDFNFSTGNGTSLLHKCCAEGNLAMAELLVLKGADVNCLDDDWWTPLHVASYQDNADIAQLLLTNGADVGLMDVDGNFPIDHAPQHSDTWDTVISFMEAKGVTEAAMKKARQDRCRRLEEDVRAVVRTAGDVNKASEADDISLLHVAAANGYVRSGRLLVKNGADVNSRTLAMGWTPLHCATKFGQAKMVELLISCGADVTSVDKGGNRAMDLAADEEIRKAIAEAKAAARRSALLADGKDDAAVGAESDDDSMTTKIVRPSHMPLSKADRLMEGQVLLQGRALPPTPAPAPSLPTRPPASRRRGREVAPKAIAARADDDDEYGEDDEDNYEEIFATTIYNTAETEEGSLSPCVPNDDLSSLPSLTERVILDTILQRYADQRIYTNMGDVLIALNPFTDLPIYGKWASKIYREAESLTSLPPHVYAIAEHAQRRMMSSRTNQCFVIGGESGAGKTETGKLLVQHLMCAASSSERQLNSKLHQINPLLEAFGNARTVMNDNSSRFAKYLQLVFAPDGCVLGGRLHQYVLEKSRVVQQSPREGNFHIFSWLLNGATPEERARCMLTQGRYRFLQEGHVGKDRSAQQKLLEVKDCMKFVGFSPDDVTNMVSVVSAVLQLGEVTFADQADGRATRVTTPEVLRNVCSLLRLQFDDMTSALTEDAITARGEELRRPLTVGQCVDNVQATAKALYSRLFAWIVNGINQMVAPLEDREGETFSIGLLDIFGFEHLQKNGFEQMCINVANERLQQFYQRQVFERERQECLSEGVQPVEVVFPASQRVLDLFMQKNTGVYDLLNEESTFPKASDETLATKLHHYLGQTFSEVYKTPRYGGTSFTVVHYAGAVSYGLDGILDTNRDTLRNAVTFVMRGSECLLVKELFQAGLTKTGSISPSARQRVSRKMRPSRSPFEFFKKLRTSRQDHKGNKKSKDSATATTKKTSATLTSHFKNSLQEMIGILELSSPHFIRCVKPSPGGRPLQADREYTGVQLRYTGVLQTAVLRKEGYALRTPFLDFVNSFPALVTYHVKGGHRSEVRAVTEVILTAFNVPLSQMGTTRVFLRHCQLQELEESNSRLTSQIVTSQAAVRRYLATRRVSRRRRARDEFRRQQLLQEEMEREEEAARRRRDEEREREERERREVAEVAGRQTQAAMREAHELEVSPDVIRRPPRGNMLGVPAEVRQSLEFLDSVISEFRSESPWQPGSLGSADSCEDLTTGADDDYQEAVSTPLPPRPATSTAHHHHHDSHDDTDYDDVYQDAASGGRDLQQLEDEMHRKHTSPQHPHPHQHPHHQPVAWDGGVGGRGAYPPPPREMYAAQTGCRAGGPTPNGHAPGGGACGRRVPPQVPERSPDTHLSTGSRKSSISSKDSSNSLDFMQTEGGANDVFDPPLPPHPHHDPTNSSSSRYGNGNRPFSYAAGLDAKMLQQRQQQQASNTNGNSGARSRGVSEGYAPSECVIPAYPQSQPQSQGQDRAFQPYGQQETGGHSYPACPAPAHQDPPHAVPQGYGFPPPPPPPQPQALGGPRTGLVIPGGGGHGSSSSSSSSSSSRGVHSHHHIVTKPHPSPPLPRRGSTPSPTSTPTPIRAASAFQPVTAAATAAVASSSSSSSSSSSAPPPTFPAPPPPLPIHDRYLAATQDTRSPSPPLPPPPPADLAGGGVKDATSTSRPGGVGPGGHSLQHVQTSRPGAPPVPPLSPASLRRWQQGQGGGQGGSGAAPHPVASSGGLVAELTQHKLRRAETAGEGADPPRPTSPQQRPDRSQSPLGVRLKPTNGKFSNIYHGQPGSSPVSPDELPPPPLPEDDVDPGLPPPSPSSRGAGGGDAIPESQLTATASRMEIDIPDDIDISQCPGLVELTHATPNWKREMIEKKNRDKIEEYVKKILREREQEAKWRNVPEWKRALLMKKDQEDQDAALAAMNAADKKAPATPPKGGGGGGGGGDQPPTMPKPKGDIVPAALSIDPAELESMPPWKRELLFKREKVPITFSNEFNPDEEEEGGEGTPAEQS